ncbi:MAG: hypothetical protein CM15mP74_07140 [Halieaceae bacterium]|nr:MAG: hypothetical protein CM15mP74_07140 [Halieaceae bacterium]
MGDWELPPFLLSIGALLSRRQETGADYFVAGRSERPLNIALSYGHTVLHQQYSWCTRLRSLRSRWGLVWLQYELAVPLAMIFAMIL